VPFPGLGAVDQVAAVGLHQQAVDVLDGPRPRLAVLPGDPPDAQDRLVAVEAHRARDQVGHRGLPRDVLGRAVLRILGAVAGLGDVRLPAGHVGQPGPECRHVRGQDQLRLP
jgi:hypothetical protein